MAWGVLRGPADRRRRGPLEDCGGLPGYEEIMDALADLSHLTTPNTLPGWPT